MRANLVAENVLGTMCWTGQIIPQNWKSWREHSTEGLSPYLVFLWAISAIFLGIYTIAQDVNIPLIVQPQLFGVLCALSWTQCIYYSRKRSFRFCALLLALYCLLGAGFEVGMVFITQVIHELRKGNSRPAQFFGVMSAVLIALGLLPQYWEIWKRKEVIGVSHVFMAIDISGGVFSLLSLVFKSEFDGVAAVTYALVVVMDAVILIAAAVLNPRAKRNRESAQSENSTLQDVGGHIATANEKGQIKTNDPPQLQLHEKASIQDTKEPM